MISLTPGQVTPAFRSLFDPSVPTGLRCFAVLEGKISGKILTNDLDHPFWGCVWEAEHGILYRGGTQEQDVLHGVFAMLRQDGHVALAIRPGDPSVRFFPLEPDAGETGLEFDRLPGSTDLSPKLDSLSGEYQVRRMDSMLMARSPGLGGLAHPYGSIENFLHTGMAFCVLRGDEILCEAYADSEVMGVREIGVVTQPAYRRQGLATIACAHLIQACEESGNPTYWECEQNNLASVALARKLGFRNVREYRLLTWFPSTESR